jgi:hypothetical protein
VLEPYVSRRFVMLPLVRGPIGRDFALLDRYPRSAATKADPVINGAGICG